MASIQARHHPACVLGNGRWRLKKLGTPGCTCPRGRGPVYHLHHRNVVTAKPGYTKVGMNLELAKRELRRLEDRLDEERVLAKLGAEPRVRRDLTFTQWADEWHAALVCKATTRRAYLWTLHCGKEAFGARVVRTLGVGDVRAFIAKSRELNPKITDSTVAKHLRVLRACLAAAIPECAEENPVDHLHRTQRPKAPAESVASYFTDYELPRLWAALPSDLPASAYKYVCMFAAATGMRQGELFGLKWGSIDLLNSELVVRESFAPGVGITTPKSGKSRVVDLTPPAVHVINEWARVSGRSTEFDQLVFGRPCGEPMLGSTLNKVFLYPAMERAKIAREGEHGRNRNFHSFRHTFARISLQAGAEMSWVQRQLGHSSITITVDRYGRWERRAEKRQAQALGSAFEALLR